MSNSQRAFKTDATVEQVCVGLIGHGIQLSRTPKMHEAEGAAQGLDYRYSLLDAQKPENHHLDFDALLTAAQNNGFAGVNVTYPFKIKALDYLDEQSEVVRSVGASNTIVFRDGKRIGHNTDHWGYRQAFSRGLADAPKGTVLLVGAGGAGGAVARALLDSSVQTLLVSDIKSAMAEELVAGLVAQYGKGRAAVVSDLAEAMKQADGIVNATPVGMASLPGSPVPVELIQARHWVSDIIYFPLETEFLAAAKAAGCRRMNGSGMAVYQAVRSFELFTGLKPDDRRMMAVFDAFT